MEHNCTSARGHRTLVLLHLVPLPLCVAATRASAERRLEHVVFIALIVLILVRVWPDVVSELVIQLLRVGHPGCAPPTAVRTACRALGSFSLPLVLRDAFTCEEVFLFFIGWREGDYPPATQ